MEMPVRLLEQSDGDIQFMPICIYKFYNMLNFLHAWLFLIADFFLACK